MRRRVQTKFLEDNGLFVHVATKVNEDNGNETVLDIIRHGHVNFVINTMSNKDNSTSKDGFLIRRVSAEKQYFLYDKFRYGTCLN